MLHPLDLLEVRETLPAGLPCGWGDGFLVLSAAPSSPSPPTECTLSRVLLEQNSPACHQYDPSPG